MGFAEELYLVIFEVFVLFQSRTFYFTLANMACTGGIVPESCDKKFRGAVAYATPRSYAHGCIHVNVN